MSSIIVSGDTSGTVSLTVPAVAGTNTLTLPAVTGTVLTTASTGTILQVKSTYLTSATQLTSGGALHELTTAIRVSITPISATSTLYFDVSGSFMFPNSNNLQYCAIYDVTNAAYVNLPPANGSRQRVHWINRTTPNDSNDANSLTFSVTVANTNTTARTYTIYHGTESALAQFLSSTLSSAGGATMPIMFRVTEVA